MACRIHGLAIEPLLCFKPVAGPAKDSFRHPPLHALLMLDKPPITTTTAGALEDARMHLIRAWLSQANKSTLSSMMVSYLQVC